MQLGKLSQLHTDCTTNGLCCIAAFDPRGGRYCLFLSSGWYSIRSPRSVRRQLIGLSDGGQLAFISSHVSGAVQLKLRRNSSVSSHKCPGGGAEGLRVNWKNAWSSERLCGRSKIMILRLVSTTPSLNGRVSFLKCGALDHFGAESVKI